MIRARCDKCKNKKWFVRKRVFYVERLKENITSQGILCGGCTRKLTKAIKQT